MVCRAGFEIRNSFEELSLHFQRIARKKLFAVNNFEQLLDDFSIDLCDSFKKNYEQKYEKIQNYERILSALNPNLPLKKGFAIIKNEDGEIVKSAKKLVRGDFVKIEFADGNVGANIS